MVKRVSKLDRVAEEALNFQVLMISKALEVSVDSLEEVVGVSQTEMQMTSLSNFSEVKIPLQVSSTTMMTSLEEDLDTLEDNHNKILANKKNQVKIDMEEWDKCKDLVAWAACSVMMMTSLVVDLVARVCLFPQVLSEEVEWAKEHLQKLVHIFKMVSKSQRPRKPPSIRREIG